MNKDELSDLMVMVGADPKNVLGRAYLSDVLRAIPFIISAKGNAVAQGVENKNLDDLIKAVSELGEAYSAISPASRVRLSEAAYTRRSVLRRVLREDVMPYGPALNELLKEFAHLVQLCKQEASRGARRDEAADESIRLLAVFVRKFGTYEVSAKVEGRFHQFVMAAYRAATGEDRDLSKSIKRVVAAAKTELP